MSDARAGRCRVVVTRLLPCGLMQMLQSSFQAWTNPDDRTLGPDEIAREAAAIRADALLVMGDFLMLAAPSSPATRGILGADAIGQLPQGAVVANVSRGDLVDDEALIGALRTGRVAAAGLDVFNGEPAIHPGYLALPNVFLQPHQGSSTLETRMRMGTLLLGSIERLRAGSPVANRLA